MKKLFTIITLLVSSFFLFSTSKVNAATHDYTVTSTDLSYINEYFLSFREKVVNYCNENNMYYYIVSRGSTQVFDAYISSSKPYVTLEFNNSLNIRVSSAIRYSNYSNNSYNDFFIVNTNLTPYSHNFLWNNQLLFHNFLDSNSSELINLTPDEFNTIYNDKIYLFESNGSMKTLYSIYEDYNKPADPFKEENEIITNFYSTLFLKIQELAISFANNYTFILIFGIFILVFVFELIWRRFL